MLDEEAAREIMAELERQDEQRKAEEEQARRTNRCRRPGRSSICRRRARRSGRTTREFVSEHDSTVERETKKYGRFEDKAQPGRAHGTASVPRPPTPAGDGRMAMRTPDLGKFLRGPGLPGPAGRAGRAGQRLRRAQPGRPEPGGR